MVGNQITFTSYYVALVVPVTFSLHFELCFLHGLLHVLQSGKGAGIWFAFIKHSGDLNTNPAGDKKPIVTSNTRSDAVIYLNIMHCAKSTQTYLNLTLYSH